MKNKLLINLLMPFATSKLEGKTFRNLLALVMVVMVMGFSWGQQVIGNFPAMNGGFEGATIDNSVAATSAATGKWTKNNTSTTIAVESSVVRSGEKSMSITNSSTGRRVWTPLVTASSTTGATTIQLFRRVTELTNTQENQLLVGNGTSGNEASTGSYTNPASAGSWLIQTYTRSSWTYTDIAGGLLTRSKGTGGTMYVDDVVVYAGNADASAPNSPGTVTINNPTLTSLDVSWAAASGGVDGGGYVVVRYASSPNADNDPNQNGIYAVANTHTNGTGSLTGTVCYIGTGTSFTDNTGLSNGTQYWYKVYTVDKAFNYSVESSGNGTTASAGGSNSTTSDIITHSSFTEPTNIAYASTQENSNLTESNSLEVAKFTLRDGGATNDTDANSTTLNAITFTIANHTNLRRLALYDGSAELSEVAISAGTATFSSLTLAAGDNSTKDFSLRASFAGTVTDNSQFSFTVSSVTADIAGSIFVAANAGAAASSTTGDKNRIIVTADRLSFAQQTSNVTLNTAMSPAPTVSANDALGNRDLDFTSSIRITSTGTLSGTPVDVIASSGLAIFNSLTHTANGSSLTLNAERTSGLDWDVTSNTFNITVQAPGLLLLEDNFEASSGTNLTSLALGYTAHSGTTSPIKINGSGLIYNNFGSTNIGNAAVIDANGEDVNRTFTSQSSGSTTYCAFLVNISSATSSGEYILHLGPSVIATEFRCRLYTKFVTGILNFGVSTNGNTVNYASNSCSYGTTYLVVLKHFFNGTTQTSSIYINPSLLNEPGAPDATETSSTSLSSNIGSVAIRQSSISNIAIIDGIRVATNWGAVTGNPQYSDNTTIAAGNYNSITTYDGSTPSISGNVNVYGQLSILGGTLTTNNTLTLKSNANGTAQVAAIGSGGSITGNVTVERYIPSGKRAFRLLSPAVTTANFISGNWQGQTHITGGLGTTGLGFDATETNNPSMFTYNNLALSGTGWTPIANTNATNLTAGVGYRMLVRGDRNVNLTVASQDNMNAAITLSATGTLRTGTVTLDASSTPAINNTSNTTTNGFSLVGNPYQSAVDWNAVTKSGIDASYYAWDPNMGTSIQRGRYVVFNGTVNSVDGGVGSSNVGQFIQPGQAFFVKNTVSGTAGTLTFQEAHKATTNANVFRVANQTESTNFVTLSMQLYDPNELAIGGYPIDATKAVFGSDYTNELGLGDATKLEAAGENIAWFRNNTKLAIDAAAPVTTSDELVMKTLRLVANKNYTFKIQTTNFDTALTPYLVDNFLNTQTEISTSQAFLATFATTSNVASYNENRFKIVFQNALLNTDKFATQVGVYPNPSKGNGFYLQLPATAQATVRLYNTLGQEIAITNNSGYYQANQSLAAGVYHIMVTEGEKTSKLKWIVE